MTNAVSHVTVFCSDRKHHSWPALAGWAWKHGAKITDQLEELTGGELLVLVSCTQFIDRTVRARYRSTFVIHESALPQGRGWSPLAWQILDGKDDFTVSLITAEDEIDSGGIVAQEHFSLEGHELSDEINAARDAVRLKLLTLALSKIGNKGKPQKGEPSYYERRYPKDSRLDPLRSIAEQFDLLRICEPRFPAFFELRGHRYEVEVRKA